MINIADTKREFIRHPTDIPLEIHSNETVERDVPAMLNIGKGGLAFESDASFSIGAILSIQIPHRNETVKIKGHVVWSRESDHGFATGITFSTHDEAFRVRMIEQICHIEAYRQRVLHEEGRKLSNEDAATEWITQFAANFPKHDDS